MAKVLLALEKYPELAFIETLLKKVGISCESCQHDLSVPELLLSFAPNLLIATANGKKVNGLKLANRLKKHQNPPHVILLSPDPSSISDAERRANEIHTVIASPIDPKLFLNIIGSALDLDSDVLLKKFERAFGTTDTGRLVMKGSENGEYPSLNSFGSSSESINVKGGNVAASGAQEIGSVKGTVGAAGQGQLQGSAEKGLLAQARNERQRLALLDLPISSQNGLKRNLVEGQVRDFRESENDPEIAEIDRERFLFAEAMFKEVSKNKKKKGA